MINIDILLIPIHYILENHTVLSVFCEEVTDTTPQGGEQIIH